MGVMSQLNEPGAMTRQDWLEAFQGGETKSKEFWKAVNKGRTRAKSSAIVVTGIIEVDAALSEFTETAKKQLIRSAMRKIAKKIRNDAVAKAPRDTGALAKAIKVVGLRKRNAMSNKGKLGVSLAVGERMFVGNEFYGGFLEFGTAERRTKAGQNRGKIEYPKFSFLRPALYENEEYAKTSFAQAIRDAIADIGRRAREAMFGKAEAEAKRVEREQARLTAQQERDHARFLRESERDSQSRIRQASRAAASLQKMQEAAARRAERLLASKLKLQESVARSQKKAAEREAKKRQRMYRKRFEQAQRELYGNRRPRRKNK